VLRAAQKPSSGQSAIDLTGFRKKSWRAAWRGARAREALGAMGDVGVPEVFEITLGLISLRAARVQLEFEWERINNRLLA